MSYAIYRGIKPFFKLCDFPDHCLCIVIIIVRYINVKKIYLDGKLTII